jgi:hypothetical protein
VADIALAGIIWLGAHVVGVLLLGALLVSLLVYLIKRALWSGIVSLLLLLTSVPIATFLIKGDIKSDFERQCASVAKTRILTHKRIKTDTIYVARLQREAIIEDGYLDMSEKPLNDPDHGFKYIETDKRFGKSYTKLYYNGNSYKRIDTLTSTLELRQTISRHSTKRYYSIDKSVFVLKDRLTGEVLADQTLLAINPKVSGWILVQSLIIPSKTYCGGVQSQAGLKYSAHDSRYAWGRHALAFVRLAVDPVSERSTR